MTSKIPNFDKNTHEMVFIEEVPKVQSTGKSSVTSQALVSVCLT